MKLFTWMKRWIFPLRNEQHMTDEQFWPILCLNVLFKSNLSLLVNYRMTDDIENENHLADIYSAYLWKIQHFIWNCSYVQKMMFAMNSLHEDFIRIHPLLLSSFIFYHRVKIFINNEKMLTEVYEILFFSWKQIFLIDRWIKDQIKDESIISKSYSRRLSSH